MNALAEITLPFELGWLPAGFLPASHANVLYQLALHASSVLEIGSWVGRSTCVMAAALATRTTPVPFHTTDFFIEDDADWQRRYGVALSSKANADVYRYVMQQPGGSRGVLERHLEARGLRQLVTIHKGDFHEIDFGRRFGLIFCDATHDRHEIDANVPRLLDLLEPRGVLACDDIDSDDLREALLRQTEFAWHHVHDTLFYGSPRLSRVAG
jgi:hypothetical protein